MRPKRGTVGDKLKPLVLEVLKGTGTGYVVLTRQEDGSGTAYQGANGHTYRLDNVKLTFGEEGDALTVEVHEGDRHIATFHIPKGDYSKTYSWLQTKTRLQLLPPRSYSLVRNSDLMATVTKK